MKVRQLEQLRKQRRAVCTHMPVTHKKQKQLMASYDKSHKGKQGQKYRLLLPNKIQPAMIPYYNIGDEVGLVNQKLK